MKMSLILLVVACAFGAASAAITCNDVHFWVEEGQFLFGNLQNAQTRNEDFHDKSFYTVSNAQHGTSGCDPANVHYQLKNGAPAKHTVTPTGYTPKVDAFALSDDGLFTFVNLPTVGKPEVWNGYTQFEFNAWCGADTSNTCSAKAYINVLFTSASSHGVQTIDDHANFNLIKNGDFELYSTPLVGCWEISDPTYWVPRTASSSIPGNGLIERQQQCIYNVVPHSGTSYIELDAWQNTCVSQTVPIYPETKYELGWWYFRNWDSQTADMVVYVDGALVATNNAGGREWKYYSYEFTPAAPKTSVTIEFCAAGSSDVIGAFLDDVHLYHLMNSEQRAFITGYTGYQKCSGSCASGMPWKARHTLPRLWDVMKTETDSIPAATVNWGLDQNIPTDGLDFEWSSNFALVTTYGTIGNMGVRFPTMEMVNYKPGSMFHTADVSDHVAVESTGFDALCLNNQGFPTSTSPDDAKDVWVWNANRLDGTLGPKYKGGVPGTLTSWYQKFGGKHSNCDVFSTRDSACKFAPLLTPRLVQDIDLTGVWKVAIDGCTIRWQGKFSWNSMRTQKLKAVGSTTPNAWEIKTTDTGCTGAVCVGFSGWQITGNVYNEAVQPNSWTQPSRGFAWIDHKYMLKIVLSQDTDFQFELGIDIFTVDLQHFRYDTSSGDHAFGYNMIVYPKTLNPLQDSAPDRRIQGFTWVENYWFAPNAQQCANCATGGMVTPADISTKHCTSSEGANSLYIGQFPAGTCLNGASPVVSLEKGPATTSPCDTTNPMFAYVGRPGISPQTACSSEFQNITLRGVAPGSAGLADFGFEGRIVLTFLLENGEHPHFQIDPKMYVKSICIEGGFAGTSHTCRGSPKWPVADPLLADLTDLPQYICEEVDARTFGPTDWAFIFFDIKDVDANLVAVKKLHIVINSVSVVFIDTKTPANVNWNGKYKYFNFRNLKTDARLKNPTYPSGSALPPQNTDFGFGFTPGAHNENIKITIYATLTILSSSTNNKNRRFAAAEEKETDNTVQESININNRANTQAAAMLAKAQSESSSAAQSNDGSSTIVTALAVACALLVAALIGMAIFIVKGPAMTPKRVNSNV